MFTHITHGLTRFTAYGDDEIGEFDTLKQVTQFLSNHDIHEHPSPISRHYRGQYKTQSLTRKRWKEPRDRTLSDFMIE